ncbi:MAG: hypothetical protein IT350_02500 [Deltaproteobacteria bacterium]|nr:hypothetical protein [Deltaproteobacteria bacterium]
MALNTTLCDPAAESIVDLAFADVYLARHPDATAWTDLGEGETGNARRERYLAAASRTIGRAPLVADALSHGMGWPRQAIGVPIIGHPVEFARASEVDGATVRSENLVGRDRAEFVGGAARFDRAGLFRIDDFDSDTGALELSAEPDVAADEVFVLVAPLPRGVLEAACEQAIQLAVSPQSAAIAAAAAGIESLDVGGPGAGGFRTRAVSPLAELCFAARRLLRRGGLLRVARSVESGRA